MTNKPLCFECRFFERGPRTGKGYCLYPHSDYHVSGDFAQESRAMRAFDRECGPDGKFFERKVTWIKQCPT